MTALGITLNFGANPAGHFRRGAWRAASGGLLAIAGKPTWESLMMCLRTGEKIVLNASKRTPKAWRREPMDRRCQPKRSLSPLAIADLFSESARIYPPTRPMESPDKSPITCIIYQNNRPFSVFAGGAEYDFEWCEADGIMAYHMSGFGFGPYVGRFCEPRKVHGAIWLAGNQLLRPDCGKRRANPIVRACGESKWLDRYRQAKPMPGAKWKRRLLRQGYRLLKSPLPLPGGTMNPFEMLDAMEGEAEWCSICLVRRYNDGWASPCEHIYECDECGQLTGPGYNHPCDCHPDADEQSPCAGATDKDHGKEIEK